MSARIAVGDTTEDAPSLRAYIREDGCAQLAWRGGYPRNLIAALALQLDSTYEDADTGWSEALLVGYPIDAEAEALVERINAYVAGQVQP